MVFNAKSAVPHQRAILIALLAAAVLVRVGVRVAFGEEYFWTGSYDIYYGMAKNIASGSGFSTFRPPLYPLFLAVTTLAGKSYLLIILPQALMGAGTALCAFLDRPAFIWFDRGAPRLRHERVLPVLRDA